MKISRQRYCVVVSVFTFLVSASDDLYGNTSATNSSTDVISYNVTNSDVITQSTTPSSAQPSPSSQNYTGMHHYDNETGHDVIKSHTDENCSNSYGWNLKGSDWGCCGNYVGCCTYASWICYVHDAMCRCCDVSGNFCGPKCKPETDCAFKRVVNSVTSVSGEIVAARRKNSGDLIFHQFRNDVMATSSVDREAENVEGSGEVEFKPKGLD